MLACNANTGFTKRGPAQSSIYDLGSCKTLDGGIVDAANGVTFTKLISHKSLGGNLREDNPSANGLRVRAFIAEIRNRLITNDRIRSAVCATNCSGFASIGHFPISPKKKKKVMKIILQELFSMSNPCIMKRRIPYRLIFCWRIFYRLSPLHTLCYRKLG